MKRKTRCSITTLNGRYKIHCDGLPLVCFNQLDFLGYYAFKDDHLLYGIDIYLKGTSEAGTRIEMHCKTKEMWIALLQVLDTI